MSDFARGPADQPLLQAKGYQIAPYICYEVVYPEFAASLAARSDLLLTISNDTWFGTSIGPLQHLQMAQMRAGSRPLDDPRHQQRRDRADQPVRQITTQIPQFERGAVWRSGADAQLTPYLQWRSWPLAIVCALLLGWALLAGRIAKTV
jgi:apolipoprotein N-acyltransferase